jgi:aclacinomycin oxidase
MSDQPNSRPEHGGLNLNRRQLLGRAGTVAVGSVAAAGLGTVATAAPANAATSTVPPDPQNAGIGQVTIKPGDVRYDSMLRGDNFRFVGAPDEVVVVSDTAQVVSAVQAAVSSGRWVAPRSGGHCFEDFTADPGIKVLLDMSPMDAVTYDPQMRAFSIQPGAKLGQVYTALFKGWGVTIPAGGCPDLGAGGHILGGGYGPLSRRYGSVVDYLHAVEVVVACADGTVRAVVATSDPNDPNHDLWWAHTGAGGGNLGVVTRYWMRTPGATGNDPAKLLPATPGEMLAWLVVWEWDASMTEEAFTTLMRNFGTWHEQNSAPGAPGTGIYAVMLGAHRSAGSFSMFIQADAGLPNINTLVTEFVDAVNAGSGVTPVVNQGAVFPWLHMVTWPGDGESGDKLSRRYKIKAAVLRKGYTDDQLSAVYAGMTDPAGNSSGAFLLIGYGGQVQAVAPDATAIPQRDAIMKAVYSTAWLADTDDDTQIGWVRDLYQGVYAATGGAPVAGEVSEGSYINYPDADLADPALNTSGVPWSTLYYGDNYPRLQQVKAKWDPHNVFHHALSIELPS